MSDFTHRPLTEAELAAVRAATGRARERLASSHSITVLNLADTSRRLEYVRNELVRSAAAAGIFVVDEAMVAVGALVEERIQKEDR